METSAMILPRSLCIVILSFYTITKEISGTQKTISLNDEETSPLALIKKGNSLLLAIPDEYNPSENKFIYKYDDSEVEFETACAIPTDEMKHTEKEWLANTTVSNGGRGSILVTGLESHKMKENCNDDATPSIKLTGQFCSPNLPTSDGKLYEVGYPVTNVDRLDIKFVSIYEVCYSTTRGTIYSIHRIKSPRLLLRKVDRFYTREKQDHLTSIFDDFLNQELNSLPNPDEIFLYDFVGNYDMPIYRWRKATNFLLNYTPIFRSAALFQGMMKYENYIRWFSKETRKQLTLYSGTHKHYEKVFWRIIKDSENRAVMIVTQYAPTECEMQNTICPQNFKLLDEYKFGGCTYICSVNDKTLLSLGLPIMQITGRLELRFRNTSEELGTSTQNTAGESDLEAGSSTQQYVQISDFKKYPTFISALLAIDPTYAKYLIDAGIAKCEDEDFEAAGIEIKNDTSHTDKTNADTAGGKSG